MNKFTLLIHNKGWKVQDACDFWGIHYDTYNKRCNSDKFHNQLECMCNGLYPKGDTGYLNNNENNKNRLMESINQYEKT